MPEPRTARQIAEYIIRDHAKDVGWGDIGDMTEAEAKALDEEAYDQLRSDVDDLIRKATVTVTFPQADGQATPEGPEDEEAARLGDAYDLDIKATALREFADYLGTGPDVPLRPGIFSALAREKAEDAEREAEELRDSVPSPESRQCGLVEVDGEPMRVQGGAEMDAAGRVALGQVVGAARRRMAEEKAAEEAAIRADERRRVREQDAEGLHLRAMGYQQGEPLRSGLLAAARYLANRARGEQT